MDKSTLQEKVAAYNESLSGVSYSNSNSADLKMYVDNIKTEWDSTHGEEVASLMASIFSNIEENMNLMSAATMAMSTAWLRVNFSTSEAWEALS